MSIKDDDQILIKNLLKKHVNQQKHKKNYSQEEIERYSGVSKEVISRIANSKTLINLHTLGQLVIALDIDTHAFFEEYRAKSKFFNQE